ncbi:MAG: hypothetical protein KKG75_02035 [Nanoarchaeota archaeon]|nr:hypothetical protein [Nanoarchaeota archaeon]
MVNPIQEAFKSVKKDIFTLRDRIEENKELIKDLKKELSKVDVDKFETKLEKAISKIKDKVDSLKDNANISKVEQDLNERVDNANELTEEKLLKEISLLKRRLTLIEKKKNIPKAPLYKKGISEEEDLEEAPEPTEESWEEEDNGKKKKGFFSKIIDFLAEEED